MLACWGLGRSLRVVERVSRDEKKEEEKKERDRKGAEDVCIEKRRGGNRSEDASMSDEFWWEFGKHDKDLTQTGGIAGDQSRFRMNSTSLSFL